MQEDLENLIPERLIENVAEWQRRLLQLDRRNSLLYFRPGRNSVHIVDQTPDGIMEALLSSRRGLTFDYAEPRSRRPSADRFPVPGVDDSENDETSEPYVIPGDLSGDCPPVELQRRLGNLRRRAREWQEEQGLNVLFLALGFWEWVDEDGQQATAPLLLLPCKLDRASPRDALTLWQDDEDITTNSTLAVKLSEFGVELVEADSGIETAGDYLDVVRRLVAHRPEWRVNDDVYLATFAYSKLAMWRDLEIVKTAGTDHNIVLTLAGSEPSAQLEDDTPSPIPPIPEDLSGARLDDLLDVRDQFAVLPADYSQLLAINAARSGSNLVIHGPPGTGKSQTIANIIATFLAEGKSVLFVSEKTAALDVVKRRLDENQLGTFCLDLHSERGSKSSVYQQLRESVDDRRMVRQLDFDYAALAERRQHLNRVVRALHQVRQPLGRTVFQEQGRFAQLREVPHVGFDVNDVETLDQGRLASILEAADRVRLRTREFEEHWTSHWRILKTGRPSIELANTIRRDMLVLDTAAEEAKAAVPELAQALGLRTPENLNEIIGLEGVARHLAVAPGVPRAWIQGDAARRLRNIAEQEADSQHTRLGLKEQLDAAFGSPHPNWDFAALIEQIAVAPAEERLLRTVLGEHWAERLVQGKMANNAALAQIGTALAHLRTVREETVNFLGLNPPETWTDLLNLVDIIQILARVGVVPSEWTEPAGVSVVANLVGRGRDAAKELDEREARLFSAFEPDVVDLIDQDTLIRYRTDHQSRVRRLLGSRHRSDRKAIRAFQRKPEKMTFFRELEVVEEIWELKRRRDAWDEMAAELAPSLQTRYTGRNTDWDSVERDYRDVVSLLEEWAGTRDHVTHLLLDEAEARRSMELGQGMAQAWTDARRLMETCLASGLAGEVQDGGVLLGTLEELVRDTTATTQRIEGAAELPLVNAVRQVPDLDDLREVLYAGARLTTLEWEHEQAQESLQADFGWRYRGFDTDWTDVLDSLSWAEELLQLLPASRPSSQLLTHAEQPQPSSVFQAIATSAGDVVQRYRMETSNVAESYNLELGPWESWGQAEFGDISQWSETLSQDADSASDWLLYQAATAELNRAVGPSATERIRQQTDDSELAPRIVERRVVGAWLDWVYQQEPVLAGFTASEQEDLIARFKELDMQLPLAAQVEVRRKVLQRYPNVNSTSARAGELGILRGELSKRRRQWPIRRLFRTIPRLIQTLKPCFLVSPLAVSQYLPLSELASETLTFDVVIFDEASQVFPEDAVPAVLRGKQLVLAGDQKQLPPSSFWRRSLADDGIDYDDDDDDDQANQLVGRESILDVAVGQVGRLFNEAHLNVHYRSRDESLIRFSNLHFYTPPGLLTFPSPGLRDSWYGVHDVYVPDGRYDAGATRTNRKEAEEVVELVFHHLRTRPAGETLGVVALSRPQADLIDRLIEERRILERDVDERFNERPDEPLFVKNLENVQGDERDHIIVCIGYGPTVGTGAVPNRFGPLNIAGGERRLNVVVTRARERMDVVHSLRANDIRSQQEGARLLRRFLEYAANPQQAFEAEVTVDSAAESESPFEAAVEQALLAKGYRVARQVGVTGYRIDLAILSEDGAKYDLGIECDGWTYHNTPAARDRDWLRQKVLEGLGWEIHRVWSTAWVRNPEAELGRIESALSRARARANHTAEQPSESEDDDEDLSDPLVRDGPVDPPVIEITPSAPTEVRLADYVQAQIPHPARWAELRYETTEKLISLIARIADVEGPVHREVVIERLRLCYGLGRVRGTTRDHVERAITLAKRRGQIQGDSTFIWSREEQLRRAPRMLVDGNIDHVPPNELKALVLETARVVFGVPRRDLVIETARMIGFSRTGGHITEVLDRFVIKLLDEGKLTESFGMIHAVDSAIEEASYVHGKTGPRESSSADRLQDLGLEVIDKRSNGGAVWVVGGTELKDTLEKFAESGVRFKFAPRGSQSTGRRPAWWTRD